MKAIYHILSLFITIVLWSCQDDNASLNSGIGYLRLTISESEEVNTRASYNPDQIQVIIREKESKKEIKSTDDWGNWEGESIELAAGEYTIIAQSYNYDNERGFDKPYYYGSQDVTVAAGKENNATVTCKLANVKVTVQYEDALLKALEGHTYSVEVGSREEDSGIAALLFENDETRAAYFPVSELYAKITVDGSQTLTQDLEGVQARDHYILNYKLTDKGSSNVTVAIDPTHNEYTYTFEINMTPVAVTAEFKEVNAWATFAYLEASNVESTTTTVNPANVSFQYRKKGATDWINIETSHENGVYTAQPTGLDGATEYEYCLAVGNENTSVETFTTEEAVILYNGGFDDWNKGTGDYKDVWFPDVQASATIGKSYWDSGNIGTASGLASILGACNPTEPEYNDVKKDTAGKLTSQYVGIAAVNMGKFAAGNIYTGHFCETYTDIYGARIRFGQPFNSRPIQLRGWYKYKRGTNVNYPSGSSDYKTELVNSGGDKCAIYIALTDNIGLAADDIPAAAFEIDNKLNADEPDKFKYKNTIDYSKNNPHIIAYGTITDEEAKGTGNWQEFTIDLKYRDLTRKPKYIIVVASASKYGDFFTGSTSSVMYIDDFELVYDGEPKTEE